MFYVHILHPGKTKRDLLSLEYDPHMTCVVSAETSSAARRAVRRKVKIPAGVFSL